MMRKLKKIPKSITTDWDQTGFVVFKGSGVDEQVTLR